MHNHNEENVECCLEKHIHSDILNRLLGNMPDEETLSDLADLFKLFGDSTRMKILFVLFKEEMCVCDLAESLNMTQSAVSHQLKSLKQGRLIKNRREGKSIFYSLADDHVRTIVSMGLEHISE